MPAPPGASWSSGSAAPGRAAPGMRCPISLTIVREMGQDMIGQVRSFNRAVTQRIGALNDAFLSRGRPLGQARLLWEIGPAGSDVRLLRSRLDLDSGYLSRLLRSLER